MKINIWIRPNERGEITMRFDYKYESRDTPTLQRYGNKLLSAIEGTGTTITPPFYVGKYGDICDDNGNLVVLIPFELEDSDLPETLCRIMNENANALAHAVENETKED